MQPLRCLVRLLAAATAAAAICFLLSLNRPPGPQTAPVRSYKYVLQWNNYFSMKNLGRGFEGLGCPVSECVFTDNRSLRAVQDFDAVLFHMYRFSLPAPPTTPRTGQLPDRRSPNQRYIFFLMEAPPNAGSTYEHMGGIFNWTMTYRQDSDIVRPYARILPIGDTPSPAQGWLQPPAAPIAPAAAALLALNDSDTPREGERTASVAWLVSHCRTASRREDYVRELSAHIAVDVYGKCGTKPWPNDDTDGFYRMLSANYTFYLSFENSLCRDYVTEKLFDVMLLDVVPVVYGGANYSAIAPPHSYVDARAFASPRHLARYLQFLARRPHELAKFGWWRRHYRVDRYPASALCDLCARLHRPAPARAYADVARWYAGPGTCQEPDFP